LNEFIADIFLFIDARVFIATLALFIALQQMWASRKHNKLSVRPLICDHTDFDTQTMSFNYSLHNKGLGTAKIKSFSYMWEGQEITERELRTKVDALTKRKDEVKISNMGQSYALSKDEVVYIIDIKIKTHDVSDKPNERLDRVTRQLITNCRVKVEFESLYDESFSFTTSTSAIDLAEYEPMNV
jgi:hypothetical protein